MNVEKFIRILGYIVYVALWSPGIVAIMTVMLVVWPIVFMRGGMTFKDSIKLFGIAMKNSIRHDVEFIRTGVWY